MTNVYKKQVEDIENVVSFLKITSAIIHYDEKSTPLYFGVSIKEGNKNGISKKLENSNIY